MEQGFDFSQLKWILIFGAIIFFNFLNKKPKVDSMPHTEEEDEHGDGSAKMTLEDLIGQILEEPRATDEDSAREAKIAEAEQREQRARVQREQKQRERERRAAAIKSQQMDDVQRNEIANSQIDGSDQNQVDFDLREAVIMSEILKRKYEE